MNNHHALTPAPILEGDAGNEARREPIAIIGMGCRFPGGANGPEEFWKLLKEGRDAIAEVPPDRWSLRAFYDPDPAKPGKMLNRLGGFLKQRVDEFDARFFGIFPQEAEHLDPQQRLLLEVAWESLEDAGLVPEHLAGKDVGVFVGAFTLDYQVLQFKRDYTILKAHTAVGVMMTMISARLSYLFDFRGPCMSIDTACSSALVSVHLACQSLWNRECSLALAGGVNIITAPDYTITESKGGFLSPDGRSKAFDASANGYTRGEGAGLVILKPLSRALADGDTIHALIRGTAVNQDGRTNGITVPRREAQEAVMRDAYRRAGVSPGQVQYVEAHGTGTPVGDPIEAAALDAILSTDRSPGEKCIVGSCKTNIGHLEAAAGAAGLIKAVLCLKHRQIPPHLHFQRPNPQIPFEKMCLRIPTTLEPWPAGDGPALAGVNSFGFGGTNAHVVLAEAPSEAVTDRGEGDLAPAHDQAPGPARLFPFSARSPEALVAVAQAYQAFLTEEATTSSNLLADLLYTASLRRSHHDHRLAIVADSKEELIKHLGVYIGGETRHNIVADHQHPGRTLKLAFVFTGMGPQWWAMGRELWAQEPVFRETVERCDELFQAQAGWSILKEMLADEAASRMADTEIAQPANVVLQLGLTALWRSWGIVPDAVVGHSVGEIAAAYVCGMLSLEDTMKVAFHRSRLQQRATGKGTMMAVGLSAEAAEQLLIGYEDRISIGAINSSSAVTLSGDAAALAELGQHLQEQQIFNRMLRVKIPYHSSHMDPLKEELLESLNGLSVRPPTTPVYSTATGRGIADYAFDASYWWQNVRQPVRFAAAVQEMIRDGYNLFLEVGPQPVLAGSITECLSQQGQEGLILPSLRRLEPERATLLCSLGVLYTQGYPVNWRELCPAEGRFIRLPSYPWQREHYWIELEEPMQVRLGNQDHPLLGRPVHLSHPAWENELNAHCPSYLDDHRIQGAIVYPGAGYIEMGLAAAQKTYGAETCALEDIEFRKALFLSGGDSYRVQLLLDPLGTSFTVCSQPLEPGQSWNLHASGRLCKPPSGNHSRKVAVDEIRKQCPDEFAAEDCYHLFWERGFHYGTCFQGIERLWRGPQDALARMHVPPSLEADLPQYRLHPAILDACFQVLIAIDSFGKTNGDNRSEVFLPVGIDRIKVYGRPSLRMWSHAHLVEQNASIIRGDIHLFDQDGSLLVDIEGFRAQSLNSGRSVAADKLDEWLYEMQWQPQARPAESQAKEPHADRRGLWIIFADQSGVGPTLASYLHEREEATILVSAGDAYQRSEDGRRYCINPARPEDYQLLCNEAMAGESLPCRGFIHLWSLDAPSSEGMTLASLEAAQVQGSSAVLHLVQALAQTGVSTRLWLITRGAQPVNDEAAPLAVAQAPLWGMGRVIGHQEHVGLWGGSVDLDPAESTEAALSLFEEIWDPDGEDQIAFRAGQRYVARVARSRDQFTSLPPQLRTDGSYLITGGLGALGLLVARWMVQRGARQLILMGRTELPPRTAWSQVEPDSPLAEPIAAIRELEALGATIHLASMDVADEAKLSAFLQQYQAEHWPPIRGVVHSAGVVRDHLLLQMNLETLKTVLRPKVMGAWALHRAFERASLDFFILFSSVSSVVAQAGQCNYAAGNAFLDALAYYRRGLGLPALAINWGPWAVGMIRDLNLAEHYAARGMEVISAEAGVQLLSRLFGCDLAQVIVVSAHWPTAMQFSARVPLLLAHLAQQDEAAATASDNLGTKESFLQQFAAVDPAESDALVEKQLLDLLAKVLRMDSSRLDPQLPLNSLNMDSLMATGLKNRIDVALGVNVSVVELLQGLSIAQLARRIAAQLRTRLEEEAKLAEALADGEQIAVETALELMSQTDGETIQQLLEELEQRPG